MIDPQRQWTQDLGYRLFDGFKLLGPPRIVCFNDDSHSEIVVEGNELFSDTTPSRIRSYECDERAVAAKSCDPIKELLGRPNP